MTCGDSNCEGTYSFIGKGTGRGSKGNPITYAEVWEGFKKYLNTYIYRSFTTAKVPCTAIDRYPVVARWRNDVGIYS